MIVENTDIPDLLCISPKIHKDSRGSFFELFQKERFESFGIEHEFVQEIFLAQ
jgi:dTDP-4-dehydrorhamnose 3,5-epimerase